MSNNAAAEAGGQLDFAGWLKWVTQQQFGESSGIFQYLNKSFQSAITNPRGFSPEALNAMRTSANDQVATNFQNAEKSVQERFAIHGTPEVQSGVESQVGGELAARAAEAQTGAQNDITLANEKEKIDQQKFATQGALSLYGATNPDSTANAETGVSNSVANNQKVGFEDSMGNSLLGAISGLAGSVTSAAGAAGGFGALFGL